MQNLKYAVHAYAWTSSWNNQTLPLIDRARRLGFDFIEIPFMELGLVDAKAIRKRAAEASISLCTSTACSEVDDPTGDDEATRRRESSSRTWTPPSRSWRAKAPPVLCGVAGTHHGPKAVSLI